MIFARAADASDDNDLFASASERVTDGEMSVGVVLFDGQNYLFAVVKLSFGVRVEVSDNDRRTDLIYSPTLSVRRSRRKA